MSLTTAKILAAAALQVDVNSLPDDLSLGDIDAWDSLGHMRLLTAIEEKRGQPLDAETAAAIESLADVARILG